MGQRCLNALGVQVKWVTTLTEGIYHPRCMSERKMSAAR